jgi:ArsR family transcriptional regulator
MNDIYSANADLLKAFSDKNRLMIVDFLSCGEVCACKILEKLSITQPTLSHHMKILSDCGIVNERKEGKWMYYTLNNKKAHDLIAFLTSITANKDDCICHEHIEKNRRV